MDIKQWLAIHRRLAALYEATQEDTGVSHYIKMAMWKVDARIAAIEKEQRQ